MTTSDQIRALVRAHVSGDNERFKLTVQQIAAHDEARSPAFARDLRKMIERTVPQLGQFVQLGQTTADLLATVHRTASLDDLIVSDTLRDELERVIAEQRASTQLYAHGLAPASKILFVGPPGVGKTMAAGALATALGIPLRKVNLHMLFSSLLGDTAKEVRKIFDQLHLFRAVYLFDEFDAMSAKRDATHEVGEMRRVVNTLLMFMDEVVTTSVIVATTNLSESIDPAMFRRFDATVHFHRTTEEIGLELVQRALFNTDGIEWNRIARQVADVSQADLVAACNDVNKAMVMSDASRIETTDLVWAIKRRCQGAVLPVTPRYSRDDDPPAPPAPPAPPVPHGDDFILDG